MSRLFADASVLAAIHDADDQYHESSCELRDEARLVSTLDLAYFEVANFGLKRSQDPERVRRMCAFEDAGGLIRVDQGLMAAAEPQARNPRAA